MSKENFMSLRPYLGDGVLGVGGKITYPKAIGTYKVLTFVNGKHGFALLKDSLWNPEAGVNLICWDHKAVGDAVLQQGCNNQFSLSSIQGRKRGRALVVTISTHGVSP